MNKFRVLTAILLGLVFSLPASEGDKQEIIKNGNFKKVAPFTKKIKKWNIIGDKMPVDWVPIFTYGNAETEVVSTSGDSPGHELRLKRGAVGQYLKVKPSPSERVMDISFELHGSKDSICLLRINSKDCLTVSKLTEVPHRYQAQYIVKPGEVVKRISFWCYSAVFTYIDKVSFKLAHSDDKSAEQVKKGDIPENAVTTTTWLKTGSNGIRLTLSFRDGGENKVSIHPFSQILSQVAKKDKVTTLTRLLPDAGLDVTGLQGNVRKFVRPNLELYKPNVQKNYIDKWESMPGAAECRFPLTFVRDNEWLRCYIDGQYAGRLTARGGLKTMVFSYSTDGEVEDIVTDTVELNRDFLALDLSRLKICGATAAKLELDKDKLPASLPLVVTPEKSLEINKTKNANKRYGRLIRSIFYTQRNAFYGADDSALFTVPSAQYVKAWALCATEPGKDTALTARLTRFVSGGNLGGRARECLADTTIELPTGSEKPGQGITQVGEVLLEGKKVPLWLVEIPLKSGDITDVLFYERGEKIKYFHSGGCYGTEVIFENGAKQRGILNFGPYLDFELTSRLIPFAHPFGDTRYLPDPNKKNGVRVFAVTLEKTPVEMEIKQTQPGNIFHNDEKPELTVLLRPLLDGNYQLRWQISDIDDQQVGSGHKNLTLQVKNSKVSVPVSLRQPRTGWYAIKIQLFKENRQLLEHNATFAQLGKDTRKAGYESPFATWWFGPSHYGTPDANIAGPMILKAGFRRAVIGASNRLSEKQLAPWKFTLASLGWPISQLKHGKDEDIVKGLNKKLKAYPHVNNAMIFHENAKNPYEQAPELIGLKPEKEDDPQADEKFKWAMRYAKILRDKFPDIKIFIGNSLACTELVAEMLRRGFPEKYADYVGNESVVRTWLPEKLGTNNVQSNWLLREIPRKFGYTKWGVTSCLEHDYRQVRLIGAQLQAEWYVRDAL
ncbi:MAG: hypothetical protein KAH24_08595, partial [Holophagae bacterium]|nr:hypothetical protein [Holophagae bacterium]